MFKDDSMNTARFGLFETSCSTIDYFACGPADSGGPITKKSGREEPIGDELDGAVDWLWY